MVIFNSYYNYLDNPCIYLGQLLFQRGILYKKKVTWSANPFFAVEEESSDDTSAAIWIVGRSKRTSSIGDVQQINFTIAFVVQYLFGVKDQVLGIA